MLRRRGTGKDRGQLLEPAGDGILERLHVRPHGCGRARVRLGEDEDERNGMPGEPFHELLINLLRRQTGVDEREDAAEIRPMLKVIVHRPVELGFVLPRHVGIAVAGQIHQPPRFVHREDVDHLGEAGRLGNTGQIRLTREHVQQRGLADIGSPDEGEFRQGFVRAGSQIRSAAIKDGG